VQTNAYEFLVYWLGEELRQRQECKCCLGQRAGMVLELFMVVDVKDYNSMHALSARLKDLSMASS
jgi:hypothetical protein